MEKILKNSQFGEIPEVLVNNELDKMMSELEQNVTNQGGKFDDYLSSLNKTKEQLMVELSPEAVKRIKTALLIREIATREGIEATEKEIEEKQKELMEQYKGYEKVEERVKEPSYKNYLHNVISNNKVMQKLKEWNLDENIKEEKEAKKNDNKESKKNE